MGEESREDLRVFDQGEKIDDGTSHQVYEYRKGKVFIYLCSFSWPREKKI